MRLDGRPSCGLGTTGGFLRNQQPLRVEVTKIKYAAGSAEFEKNISEVTNAVHKPIATAVDDRTEKFLLGVPATIGMPRRRILDDDDRLMCGLDRPALPRQRLTDHFAAEVFSEVQTFRTEDRRVQQRIQPLFIAEDLQ